MKKTIIFNKKVYKDFRDMYADIYKKLDGQHTIDFENLENLKYSRDILNEFLWNKSDENLHYQFLNFDRDRIASPKIYDDYEYNFILKLFENFVIKYPNNSLEYRNEE